MAKRTTSRATAEEKEVVTPEETTEETETTPTAPEEAEADAEETTANEVHVSYINANTGLTTRVFSYELHGKDYKKLAAEFAETNNGAIV